MKRARLTNRRRGFLLGRCPTARRFKVQPKWRLAGGLGISLFQNYDRELVLYFFSAFWIHLSSSDDHCLTTRTCIHARNKLRDARFLHSRCSFAFITMNAPDR
jgi:hypothetical protein